MNKKTDYPVATAAPIVVEPLPNYSYLSKITIPAGLQNIGVEFVDAYDSRGSNSGPSRSSPSSSVRHRSPRVGRVDPKSPLYNDFDQLGQQNNYVHVLKLPSVEIFNIVSSNHLMDLIISNFGTERHLFLSSSPEYVDDSVGVSSTAPPLTSSGAMYKHDLPSQQDLGIIFVGFPPVVNHVSTTSVLYGRAVPGQTAQALLVPGMDRFDIDTGGFRSDVLKQRLDMSANIPGRILVLKDAPHTPKEKGSSQPFDDGCCTIQ
mmetsp:Transcript_24326/g.57635  ORF Transcript_24326/g.57635 Transcript_24326/m.57635 type:complete len:261 (+) Transcript_24326:112-894(+)